MAFSSESVQENEMPAKRSKLVLNTVKHKGKQKKVSKSGSCQTAEKADEKKEMVKSEFKL